MFPVEKDIKNEYYEVDESLDWQKIKNRPKKDVGIRRSYVIKALRP